MTDQEVVTLSTSHIVSLMIIGLGCAASALLRQASGLNSLGFSPRRAACLLLAGILPANFVFEQCYELLVGTWSIRESLPLHLCDIAVAATVVALIGAANQNSRRPQPSIVYELAFYWGLGGTLQAILTPDLEQAFPSPRFFTYFIGHGTIVISAAALTLGIGMRPRPWSALRVWLITNATALPVLAVNYFLGSNYMFLCGPPTASTVLNYLGEWPWPYLFLLDLLALGIMSACYGLYRIAASFLLIQLPVNDSR